MDLVTELSFAVTVGRDTMKYISLHDIQTNSLGLLICAVYMVILLDFLGWKMGDCWKCKH